MNLIPKNSRAHVSLQNYAKKVGKPLKEVLLDEAHLDNVVGILYNSAPSMIKFTVKKEKFKDIYNTHKETIIKNLKLA